MADINAATYGNYLIDHGQRWDRRSASPRALATMLWPSSPSAIYHFDDFLQVVIPGGESPANGDMYTLAKDDNATNFATPATLAHGGTIAGTTGTDDEDGYSLKGALYLSGDKNAGFRCRWKVSAFTAPNGQLEMGLVDALTDDTLPAMNDIDTPSITNGAVTVAVMAIDQSQTLATAALLLDGDSTYSTRATALGTFTPTVDTYYETIIQTMGDSVRCAILNADGSVNVETTQTSVASGSGFEGGTLVQPWVYVRSKTVSTANVLTLDYISWWADR